MATNATTSTTKKMATNEPIAGVVLIARVREARKQSSTSKGNGLDEDKLTFTVRTDTHGDLTFMWSLRDFVYHIKLNGIATFRTEPVSFQDISVNKAIKRFRKATIEGTCAFWKAGYVYKLDKKSTKLIVGHKNYDSKAKPNQHIAYKKDGYKFVDEPVIEESESWLQRAENAEAKAEDDYQRMSQRFVINPVDESTTEEEDVPDGNEKN